MFTLATHYISDRQTVRIECQTHGEVGAVQQNKRGTWIPRHGIGAASELPAMDWEAPTNPQVAIDWVTARHTCQGGK